MFFIFSKDKIISYCISFFMVLLLLGIAFKTKNNNSTRAAASNSIQQNNGIYQTQNK
ncbi:MAG: hypothetical protein IJH12_03965 [Clostridia bacterium]|nr:hypothetical protein [Clostridia bacterium]